MHHIKAKIDVAKHFAECQIYPDPDSWTVLLDDKYKPLHKGDNRYLEIYKRLTKGLFGRVITENGKSHIVINEDESIYGNEFSYFWSVL